MATRLAHDGLPHLSLDAAGLIALAELTMIARHTVLKGTAYYTDALVLCPGIHRQQHATTLNGGEYPITANTTSGYVFRVENQATVHYLQTVGKTGHLTTLNVESDKSALKWMRPLVDVSGSLVATVLYLVPTLLTAVSLALLALVQDYWGLGILLALALARLLNVIVVRRRCDAAWHGAREPGQKGDLLVLLSQDRWVRMKGLTDDLKAVTSGQWLRETTFFESSLESCSIVIVYLCAALGANASELGKITFLVLLLVNAGFLALSNQFVESLQMKGCKISVSVSEPPKKYKRRLELAEELVAFSERKDWAIKIGMINEDYGEHRSSENQERKSPRSRIPTVQV